MNHRFDVKEWGTSRERKPGYFDEENDYLVVIQYGAISAMQSEYIKSFFGDLKGFEDAVSSGKLEISGNKKSKKVRSTIFTLDLKTLKWNIRNNPFDELGPYHHFADDDDDDDKFLPYFVDPYGDYRDGHSDDERFTHDPTYRTGSGQMVRIGDYLVMIGGEKSAIMKHVKDLYFLKIPRPNKEDLEQREAEAMRMALRDNDEEMMESLNDPNCCRIM